MTTQCPHKEAGQNQNEIMQSSRKGINNRVLLAYGALAAVIFVLVASGVVFSRRYVESNTIEIGELQTASQSVDGEGATSVEAVLILGFGEMAISGGAEELLELAFTSNLVDLHPVVRYEVEDGVGNLQLEPSVPTGIPDPSHFAEYRSEWDVRLNNHTPLELQIVLGTGVGNLDLRGLTLTDLAVVVGAGQATIDLRGEWPQSFEGRIEGGTGQTTLILPGDRGVRVEVEQGMGVVTVEGLEELEDNVYVNSAYAGSGDPLRLEAVVGIGELMLAVDGWEEE
jgi:hypothetical protein